MKYVLFSYDGRINRNQYWSLGILPLFQCRYSGESHLFRSLICFRG